MRVPTRRPSIRRAVLAAILTTGLLGFVASPADAECQGSYPSFRDALSTANAWSSAM